MSQEGIMGFTTTVSGSMLPIVEFYRWLKYLHKVTLHINKNGIHLFIRKKRQISRYFSSEMSTVMNMVDHKMYYLKKLQILDLYQVVF
jgi:hypothetical protein